MEKTPVRRSKSVDLDDPFTPIPKLSNLRSPRTSREFICPLRTTPPPEGSENSTTIPPSPVRKRGIEESSVTPLHRKNGPPLLKKSSMSKLADGFRSAANLINEGENDDDPFGLSFRNYQILLSKKVPETSRRIPDEEEVIDPSKCLPERAMEKYKRIKKLEKFYDWQQECLSDKRLLNGENCILSLPTGAGKTLIAEILMLREAIVHKRNAILVLPYVAIVQEKISSLAPFEDAFGINIEEYASNKGRFPPIKRRKRVSVYVATIEKANMLINSLITQNQLDQIGMVVVDELHMIGDGGRGAILEQLLAKFLYKGSGQIVGMSATLPNIDDLQFALRSFVYSTNFRPVELAEFVKIGQTMHQVENGGDLKPAGDLPTNNLKSTDPDGICQLLAKLIPKSSAVIFCPNKKNCENVAVLIAKTLPAHIRQAKRAESEAFLQSYLTDNDDERMDADLKQCILSGVAYHHSGLTQDERKCVEAAFMEGLIYVVCATSTLAAGVNLPVRRVIIKCPMVGRERLGKAQYLQMAGRAGRAGFDTKGDCITIVKQGEEERWFREMLKSDIPRCMSSLSSVEAMGSFILDMIVLKIAKNLEEVLLGVQYSLYAAQESPDKIRELVEKSLQRLEEHRFLTIEDREITPSDLGSAVFNAGFAPEEATRLHTDLISSLNQGVIFSSHFHLLFIITPYEQVCNINWDLFLLLYNALPQSERKLLGECGLEEKFILEAIITRVDLIAGTTRMRLYIALMLQKIWNHEPMFQVAERFGVEKGWLQATLQSSISQAASIAKFSEKITTMWPLRKLLPELVQRLSEAAQPELLPLMTVDGVKKARAAILFKAGYKTVGMVSTNVFLMTTNYKFQIARANPLKLVQELGTIRLAQAKSIINSAKMVLRDQVDEKMEELDVWGVATDNFDYF
ncbi:Protein CBG15258 [Caenorhabditis briggsae]|uniref:Protein CBG15258 n=1 Tax=Caenorhabditis briggsae TaxID=6238 RepID=A8XLJ6_CAEBR|nr:Protein CBG15258 [Caenorhabditis briggsae]CAP33500.2 Protein CBG15258 [Caenorhabditis briggsae]